MNTSVFAPLKAGRINSQAQKLAAKPHQSLDQAQEKRTPFSAKVFLDRLVKFIIADDQVRTVCIIFTTILISLSL
jgi:hypothetical protein